MSLAVNARDATPQGGKLIISTENVFINREFVRRYPHPVQTGNSAKLAALLVVDDDESVRGLLRLRLSDSYEVFDTGDSEQAVAIALGERRRFAKTLLGRPGNDTASSFWKPLRIGCSKTNR